MEQSILKLSKMHTYRPCVKSNREFKKYIYKGDDSIKKVKEK